MLVRKRKAAAATETADIAASVDAVSGVTGVLPALDSLAPYRSYSSSWKRKLAADVLYAVANTHTAYGNVCTHDSLVGGDGILDIYHVIPEALLTLACDTYLRFGMFLTELVDAAPGGLLNIVFYLE